MFPAGAKEFSLLQKAHTGSGVNAAILFIGYQGYCDQEAKQYCHEAR